MLMANRSLYSKVHTIVPYYLRRPKSSVAASISSDQRVTIPKPRASAEPYINLDDSKMLFTSVSTAKLIAATFIHHFVLNNTMIDIGSSIMNSRLMKIPGFREVLIATIEHSFYPLFCGGKNRTEAYRAALNLYDSGIQAMLDYGMEHADNNTSCDQNVEEIIKTIQSTKLHPTPCVSSVVVKITAICTPRILKRVSDLLRWQYKDNSFNLPWKLHSFPLLTDSSALYHTPTRPDHLTLEEELDLELGFQRLIKICENSSEANMILLIDAEDTCIQPAIDYFTYYAAMKYHRGDSPLIFNTIQAYLKDAKERLVMVKKAADEAGVPMGIKLVRGAYMSSERNLALSLEAKSPIHDCIEDTHACYNDCAAFMLEQIANGSGSLVLATHNIESGKLAAAKLATLGIKKDNKNLQFAQLYGMAESFSFALRNEDFRVSKYLPFGAVKEIMSYLLRRAEENRGFISTASLDKRLMRKESFRRLKNILWK